VFGVYSGEKAAAMALIREKAAAMILYDGAAPSLLRCTCSMVMWLGFSGTGTASKSVFRVILFYSFMWIRNSFDPNLTFLRVLIRTVSDFHLVLYPVPVLFLHSKYLNKISWFFRTQIPYSANTGYTGTVT
jgi:hypothetical protein